MSRVLPPKPRLGPAPPPRPPAPISPDAAWEHLHACLEHFARVAPHADDYTVAVAVTAVHRALEAYHRALQPACYGGTSNYG
jgi:hypothetical protein